MQDLGFNQTPRTKCLFLPWTKTHHRRACNCYQDGPSSQPVHQPRRHANCPSLLYANMVAHIASCKQAKKHNDSKDPRETSKNRRRSSSIRGKRIHSETRRDNSTGKLLRRDGLPKGFDEGATRQHNSESASVLHSRSRQLSHVLRQAVAKLLHILIYLQMQILIQLPKTCHSYYSS